MAYMRGENYIWHDAEDNLHIWSKDGYDGWDVIWAADETGESRAEGYKNASGVSLPMDVMDEYVVKRLAQMIYEGMVEEAIERAITENTNIGGIVLKRNATKIREALSQIKLDTAEPYARIVDENANTTP